MRTAVVIIVTTQCVRFDVLCGWSLICDVFVNNQSCKLFFADFLMIMTRLMKALRSIFVA